MKNVQEIYIAIAKINRLNLSQVKKDALINCLLDENGVGVSTLQGLKRFLLKEVIISDPTSLYQTYSGEVYPQCENSDFPLSSTNRQYGVFKIHENVFIPVQEEISRSRLHDLYYLKDSFTGQRITNFFKNSPFNDVLTLPWDDLEFDILGDYAYAIPLIDLFPLQAIYRTFGDKLFVTENTMYSLVDKTNEFLARNPDFIENAFAKRRTK